MVNSDWRIWRDVRDAGHAARGFARYMGSDATIQRQQSINAHVTVKWKGRTLYPLLCLADFGKGPHVVNVPEFIMWCLISPTQFRCVYHNN